MENRDGETSGELYVHSSHNKSLKRKFKPLYLYSMSSMYYEGTPVLQCPTL